MKFSTKTGEDFYKDLNILCVMSIYIKLFGFSSYIALIMAILVINAGSAYLNSKPKKTK